MRLALIAPVLLLAACSPASGWDSGPADSGGDLGQDIALDATALDAGDGAASDGAEDAGTDIADALAPVDAQDAAGDARDGGGDATDPCDVDRDGHRATSCGGDDCDDTLAYVYPGAVEHCDGTDENCDGVADALPDGGFDPRADDSCASYVNPWPAGLTLLAPHCYRPDSTRCVLQCAAPAAQWFCAGCGSRYYAAPRECLIGDVVPGVAPSISTCNLATAGCF